MNTENKNYIHFANILRGLAALMVVYFHLFETFWLKNDLIGKLCQLKKTGFDMNSLPHLKIAIFLENNNINLGFLGVAIFFLISGFVIPISLEKKDSLKFLIQRFFRIYPTYITGMLITVLVSFLYMRFFTGEAYQYTLKQIFLNATLFLRDPLTTPSVDGINWTLEIEMKYYLIMALIITFLNIKRPLTLVIVSLFIALLQTSVGIFKNFYPEFVYNSGFLFAITFNSFYLIFMLIGTCFYNLYKKNFSKKIFLLTSSFLAGLCIINNLTNYVLKQDLKLYLVNFALALLIFAAFYILRNRIKGNILFNFFADISYPLYIIHGFNSYIIITILYNYIRSPYICIFFALIIIFPAAYLLHKLCEIPTNNLGKKIAGFIASRV